MVCVKMICQLTVLNYFLLQRRRWDCVNVWGTTEFVGRKTAFFMSITIDWIWCEGEHFPETKIDPEKLSFYSIYNLLIISFVLHYRASIFRVRKVVKSFQWLYKVQFWKYVSGNRLWCAHLFFAWFKLFSFVCYWIVHDLLQIARSDLFDIKRF